MFGDDTGLLGYYRYVDERRPDVSLYNLQGLVFDNRLFDPLAGAEEKQRALDRFVAGTEDPCSYSPTPTSARPPKALRHHGFLLEVLAEGTAGTIDLTRFSPATMPGRSSSRPSSARAAGSRPASRAFR